LLDLAELLPELIVSGLSDEEQRTIASFALKASGDDLTESLRRSYERFDKMKEEFPISEELSGDAKAFMERLGIAESFESDSIIENANDTFALSLLKSGEVEVDAATGTVYSIVGSGDQKKKVKLSGTKHPSGYLIYQLGSEGKVKNIRAHRLIWMSVNMRAPGAGKVIHHKDGNRLNNKISNLQLRNKKANDRDGGLVKTKEGESIHEDRPQKSLDVEICEGFSGSGFRCWVTVIEEGWSKNGRFYDAHALSQLKTLLEIDRDSRKVFFNHLMGPVNIAGGRDFRDHAATVIETKQENGRLRALWHVFEEPYGKFLRERIDFDPGDVGISIDARAKMSMGERNGIRGKIVDDIVQLSSMDLVVRAAAGGRVEALAESLLLNEDLQKMLKRGDVRQTYWQLHSALDEGLRLIYKDDTLDKGGQKKKVDKLLDDYVVQIKKLDLDSVFGEEKYESQDKQINMESEEVKESMETIKTLAVLKESYMPLLEEFKKEVLEGIDMGNKVRELKESVAKKDEENKSLVKKLEDAEKKVKTLEADVAIERLRGFIDEKLKEAEFPEGLADEAFVEKLRSMKTEDAISEAIAERKQVWEKAQEVISKKETRDNGLGPAGKKQKNTTGQTELTDADIKRLMNANA